MNFGSKYVYDYDESDEECVSEDEFDEGMNPALPPALPVSVTSHDTADSVASSPLEPRGTPPPAPPPPSNQRPKSWRSSLGQSIKKMFHASSGEPQGELQMRPDSASVTTYGEPIEPCVQRHSRKKGKKVHHWMQKPESRSLKYQSHSGQKWRRADTNIISVKFDQLTAPSNMHTGDTVKCSNCSVVLSHVSKLVKDSPESDREVWECEFCGEHTLVDLMEEEKPTKDDVTYMLEPAPSTQASGRSGTDQTLIIFCIDTSGSMCVTTEIAGHVRMRGDRLARLQSLNVEHEDQFLPGQRRNVTYLSRLQSVQAAVDHQLQELDKEYPDRRVALLAFSSEVCVVGDGSSEPVHIAGDKLNKEDELLALGTTLQLPQSISSSRTTLSDKVFELEEGGQTSLGPALLVAVAMAGQVPGSKVIICTDGMANVGVGSLDVGQNDDAYERAHEFYSKTAEMASQKGVSISVTSIKDTRCQLVELGKLAESTGGQVNIVDPLKLTQEFGNILADPIIATNVLATLIVHKNLYFREEGGVRRGHQLVKEVGNVTSETEVTFEYGVNKQKKNTQEKAPTEKPSEDKSDTVAEEEEASSSGACARVREQETLPEVPFQLQIEYTDMEGARALRVITQTKPMTSDREQVEREMNRPVIEVHAAKASAGLALQGSYTSSRMKALMNQRLLYRNVRSAEEGNGYEQYCGLVGRMENNLASEQKREVTLYGRRMSDDEDEDDECYADQRLPKKKLKKKALARRKEVSDSMAEDMYSNIRSTSKQAKK